MAYTPSTFCRGIESQSREPQKTTPILPQRAWVIQRVTPAARIRTGWFFYSSNTCPIFLKHCALHSFEQVFLIWNPPCRSYLKLFLQTLHCPVAIVFGFFIIILREWDNLHFKTRHIFTKEQKRVIDNLPIFDSSVIPDFVPLVFMGLHRSDSIKSIASCAPCATAHSTPRHILRESIQLFCAGESTPPLVRLSSTKARL